jgi:hypothetical protein
LYARSGAHTGRTLADNLHGYPRLVHQ